MIRKTVLKQTVAATALAALGAIALPSAAVAKEVTLKSSDGTVNIVGDFVAFEDNAYVVKTGLGELRISASRVRCEGAACPEFETNSADVVLAGSDAVGVGLMPLLMSGFASHLDAEAEVTATNNEKEILASFIGDDGFGDAMGSYLVSSTTSSDAFTNLLDGSAEIGMASRRIEPKEARELKKAGAGNMIDPAQEHIIAVETLVIVTHPDNPINELTKEQVRDMYSGRVTNWSQIGGPDAPVVFVTQPEGSGERELFEKVVFAGKGAEIGGQLKVSEDHNQTAALVNENLGGIGFVGYAFQRGAKPVTLVNHCGMPMTPNAFSAKTEEYALQRRLYLYNRGGEMTDLAKDFVDYATSEAADSVITKAGFMNLGISKQEQSLDSPRARALLNSNADAFESGVMREMLSQMVDYDRLSTTFRFKTGSSKLDERGRIDMARLVDYLEGQEEGTKVMIVGFTDDVGAFESNRFLSIERAAKVKDSLREFGGARLAGIQFDHSGFGEVAPAFCNTDDNGRAINRRVEVWIEKPNAG